VIITKLQVELVVSSRVEPSGIWAYKLYTAFVCPLRMDSLLLLCLCVCLTSRATVHAHKSVTNRTLSTPFDVA